MDADVAYQAGVVGASGYGGVELVRLLEAHPDLDLEVVAARSHARSPLAELFPNLAGERVFAAIDRGPESREHRQAGNRGRRKRRSTSLPPAVRHV